MFVCPRCHYESDVKNNFIRHLMKKTQCKAQFSNEEPEIILQKIVTKPKDPTTCEWCNKTFAFKSGLSRHRKTCILIPVVKASDTSLKQSQVNNTQIINNYINIAINCNSPAPFLKENITHIPDEYVYNCAQRLDNGLIDLIKSIRFNPEHPENMNVKMHRKKQKTLYVFNGERWNICDAKWTLEEMIVHGARILYQKMLTQVDQEKFLDEDSTESKIQSWLLSVLPKNNEKIMGKLSRRIYAMILDNQLLLMEQQTDDEF